MGGAAGNRFLIRLRRTARMSRRANWDRPTGFLRPVIWDAGAEEVSVNRPPRQSASRVRQGGQGEPISTQCPPDYGPSLGH